jgi:hypothetical protein
VILIHRIYLQVTLPRVEATVSSAFFRWVNFIGHFLIKSVEVQIGGQRIDKQYGDWLTIWNELTIPPGLKAGYDNMVGNTVALTGTGLTKNRSHYSYMYLSNSGSAETLVFHFLLLLFNTTKSKSNLNSDLKLNAMYPLVAPSTAVVYPFWQLRCFLRTFFEYASFFIDYIYLDTDERRRFAQTSHEYLD